jgi:hypothetical protein
MRTGADSLKPLPAGGSHAKFTLSAKRAFHVRI